MGRFSAVHRKHFLGSAMAGAGLNLAWLVYYTHAHQMVDIAKGGGPSDSLGTLILAADRDSEDWPNVLRSGATYFGMSFQTPEVSEPYTLTWDTGGTGTGQINIVGSGGFSGLANGTYSSGITVTPQAMTAGVGNNFIHYTLVDSSYPKHFSCRPVSDPGGTWGANFISKFKALSSSSKGPVRVLHQNAVEANGIPSGTTVKFPQDGDGQLQVPILTAANRNKPTSACWASYGANTDGWKDGLPVELCVSLATALDRDLWYPVHWNADGTNTDGSPGTSTYYPAIAALLASFAQTTGHDVIIELSNEIWNGGYLVSNQAINEGSYRGQGADCHPSVVTVTTGPITLSGTQTINGVAVTAGQRVLVIHQGGFDGIGAPIPSAQDGVYIVSSGAWSRAADTLAPADKWFSTGGTTSANTTWYLTNTGTITVGTTPLSIIGFDRCARIAEKSAQIFGYFETAFASAGVSSKLVRTLSWQNVADPSVWNLFFLNPVIQGHVDALSTAPYYDVTQIAGNGYTGSTATYYADGIAAVDDTLNYAAAHAAYAYSKGLKYYCYELGDTSRLTDPTFFATWQASSLYHDLNQYYLNEIRRRFPNVAFCWHDFIDGSGGNVTSGADFSLLHQVTDSIAATPRALAIQEAVGGTFKLFDPTITIASGSIYNIVGSVVATVSNGLLPEATYSLSGTGASNFTIVKTTDAQGATIAQIQVSNAGVTAGTYNLSFVQTYGSTQTTAVPSFTMHTLGAELWTNGNFSSAAPPPTLVDGTISGGKLNLSAAAQFCYETGILVNGQTYHVTLDYTKTSGGNLRVNCSTTNGAAIPTGGVSGNLPVGSGSLVFDFVATGTALSLEADALAFNGTLDNVSCKQVTG